MVEIPLEHFNFRHIIALIVLYGGCMVLMLIGGIWLRSLCRLQKKRSAKPTVLRRIISVGMGIFTFCLPLFFSGELSPVSLTSVETILIGFGYLLSAIAFTYMCLPETKASLGRLQTLLHPMVLIFIVYLHFKNN
jgi:hypothetical protein